MKRFRQISAEEMLKLIPMAPNIVILEENGDGWYWLNDYVADRFANATILIEEPGITQNTEETPKKQEEKKQNILAMEEKNETEKKAVKEEKQMTPEETLYEKINKMAASSETEQESVDPEKCIAIIKAYLSGKNIKEVAKEFNVTQKTAREVLLKNRTPLRVSRAFYKSIRQAAEDGRALEDIAEDFHTDVDHIREIIDGGKE